MGINTTGTNQLGSSTDFVQEVDAQQVAHLAPNAESKTTQNHSQWDVA